MSNVRSILAAAALPCPVPIRLSLGSTVVQPREHVGLLLEWRQVADDCGVTSGHRLVVFVLAGPGKEGAWELRQRWLPVETLTPIG